jgi:hypothetical protein
MDGRRVARRATIPLPASSRLTNRREEAPGMNEMQLTAEPCTAPSVFGGVAGIATR